MPWLRFAVTRGKAKSPLLATRKITWEDLRKVDGAYLYVVE